MKKYLLLSLVLFGSISYAMPGKEDCDQELHDAIYASDEAAVRLLLDQNADVNVQDKYGFTPLFRAIVRDHETIVRLLLDKGANVNGQNCCDGRTELSTAALRGKEAIVRLLLDKGTNVNGQDRDGQIPLHWAALRGKEIIVRLLLNKGADVNAQSKWGYTPFDSAVAQDNEAIARFLLGKIANPTTKITKATPVMHGLINNEISKRRAAMIWTLKGVHHTGPQAEQELEQKDSLPALPSLAPEIVENIMLKADPTLKRTLLRNYLERLPLDQIDYSDIFQRFLEANLLDDLGPALDRIHALTRKR